MSDGGASNTGAFAAGPKTVQLNPERAPALIAKWQKLLGKDLEKIEVVYTAAGVAVTVTPLTGGPSAKAEPDVAGKAISIAAYKAAKQEAAKPSESDAEVALRNKFELRLNKEFPSGKLKSGSDASIQAFLQGLPFHERRAMLMSNKQFKTAYPNGYSPAPAVAGATPAASGQS
jgi:hypothetical protein